MSVGDTVFSPPTTDARLTIQFISLPTFHLEGRRILVFLIKLSSFLKQIFHIYHFLEEKHFYKKNVSLLNEGIEKLTQLNQFLLNDGRMEDLVRAVTDPAYRDNLLKEYHL